MYRELLTVFGKLMGRKKVLLIQEIPLLFLVTFTSYQKKILLLLY